MDVAVNRGAVVYPYLFKDASAARFAGRCTHTWSDSAAVAVALARVHERFGTHWRIVFTSPNHAKYSSFAAELCSVVIARCLRDAGAAVGAFRYVKVHLLSALRECASGRELIARGYTADVEIASASNASNNVSLLRDGAYVDTIFL